MGGDWGSGWGNAVTQNEKQDNEFEFADRQENRMTPYWDAVKRWGTGNSKLVADRSSDTLLAEQLTRQRALSGSPLVKSAQQNIQDILSGKNFDQNFNNQWGETARKLGTTYSDITMPSIDARFSIAGRTGSGAASSAYGKASEGLGTSLSDLASNIYNTERQRQIAATQMAPTLAGEDYKDIGALNAVGSNQQAYQQSVIDAESNKLRTWAGLMQPGLGLAGLKTGSSGSGTSSGNPLASLLGMYMQNPQMFNSMGNGVSNWWNNYDSNTGGYTGSLGGADGNYGGMYDWNSGEGSFGGME